MLTHKPTTPCFHGIQKRISELGIRQKRLLHLLEGTTEKVPSTLAQTMEKKAELSNQLNGSTALIPGDRNKTMENLAAQVTTPEKVQEYKVKLEKMIAASLQPGVKFDDLWSHVEGQFNEKGYQQILIVIVKSLLKFYGVKEVNGQEIKEEINITGFLNQGFKIKSSVGEAYDSARNDVLVETRTGLSDLLADIQAKI